MEKMTESKTPMSRFLYENGLSKKEVAEYLGMSPQAVSQMASGKMKMPSRVFAAIRENANGWDTAALTSASSDSTEALLAQLRAKDEQISELHRIIDNLTSEKK